MVKDFDRIKAKLSELIDKGELALARELISSAEKVYGNSIELLSIKAVVFMLEGKTEEANDLLLKGLEIEPFSGDLIYNLAYIYELKEDFSKAYELYIEAKFFTKKDGQDIDKAIKRLKKRVGNINSKRKIAFFVKQGLDSFLTDIIKELSTDYNVKKVIVRNTSQINLGMDWADICWFEWCDELIAYGSKTDNAKKKIVLCRLHSYEAFTSNIRNVSWENVNKIIFVGEHVKDFVIENVKGLSKDKTIVISNGVNADKYKFRAREKGYNIAFVGYINYKKGPMLLIHTFKAIYDRDKRYKLFIAGEFQDPRYVLYMRQMIKELGLEGNVFYEGWQNDINNWLEDKNYIISTSVLESNHLSIMEAMAKGIKPIVHNFVGSKTLYGKYVWNTIEEAVNMVTSEEYDSFEYMRYIEKEFSLKKQISKIKFLIESMLPEKKEVIEMLEMSKGSLKDYVQRTMNTPERMIFRSEFIELINRYFELRDTMVLEIGCNSGDLCVELSMRGAKITGIDLRQAQIRLAEELSVLYKISNYSFKCCNIKDLTLNDSYFDIIFCINDIKFIKNNIKEMIKLGKYIILGIPMSFNNISKHKYVLKKMVGELEFRLLHEELIGYHHSNDNNFLSNKISMIFNNKKDLGNIYVAIFAKSEKQMESFKETRYNKIISFKKDKLIDIHYPSVSIIVPIYNGERHIKKLVNNIKKLDYPNFQVIYVNDCSVDNTGYVLRKELIESTGIDYNIIDLNSNVGEMSARLEGIKKSSGKYIYFHDVDDTIYMNSIKRLMIDINNFSDITHLATSCAIMKESFFIGQIWYHHFLPSVFDYIIAGIKDLCGKVSLSNALFKRDIILDGYKEFYAIHKKINIERMSVGGDTLLINTLLLEGLIKRVVPVFYTLLGYEYDNDASASKNFTRRINDIPVHIANSVYKLRRYNVIDKDSEAKINNIISIQSKKLYGENYGDAFWRRYCDILETFRKE